MAPRTPRPVARDGASRPNCLPHLRERERERERESVCVCEREREREIEREAGSIARASARSSQMHLCFKAASPSLHLIDRNAPLSRARRNVVAPIGKDAKVWGGGGGTCTCR